MTHENFLSVHRTWIHADLMFHQFEKNMRPLDKKAVETFFVTDQGTYLLLWYGLLFVTLECLKEHNAIPTLIIHDVDAIYDALRHFRNAAFHAQPEYYSPKLLEIMEVQDSPATIRKIHSELDRFFLSHIQAKTVPI